MSAPEPAELRWVKSSRSGYNGNCVEVAAVPDGVLVRDSKDPQGPRLSFDGAAWTALLTSIKAGEIARR